MPVGEWLPSSLGGGAPERKPTVLESIRTNMNNTMAPARENAASAAQMAGFGQQDENPPTRRGESPPIHDM